ncbi:BREX-2 system phosphatase PglZ [Actinoplanes solisilvae]|uniref:BREX-2 system phosphatase PglZ n=1 Tax=Actinoplanes solisilvae TaxID=2486853 RepID=UPI000FDCA8F9|nr:BREX-2 system phosphatase PglZ [Actinoplanes solisilvae]
MAATQVSASMVLAIVDEARAKNYRTGVIGIRGIPDQAITADLPHQGQTVRIRAAESALAARELLGDHRDGDWLVVVTDRDDEDLGAGVLAHFIWQRLRSPDPWEAVRTRFAATGIDPALTSRPDNRELATALVAATPAAGWPAAPAGVLTRNHALGAVAAIHLGFDTDTADVLGVLRWSIASQSVGALGALRRGIGDLLADTTLDWIAQRSGPAAGPVRALLSRGELADVVPLGLVLRLLTSDGYESATAHQAQLALVRLEPRWGDLTPSPIALAALGQAADSLLSDLVHDRRADEDVARCLDRADAILTQLQAEPLARYSELLTGGLRARLDALADALRRTVSPSGRVDNPDVVESAWAAVRSHRLGATTPLRVPFEAAVRLVRWLSDAHPEPDAGSLAVHARDYLDNAAWADAAINDAFGGIDDPTLSSALHAVVTTAQTRRRAQERRFAQALTSAPTPSGRGLPSDGGTLWYLEQVLPGAVMPLARKVPVLLLVLDGMSAAVATEILADATARLGWLEAVLPGADKFRRAGALAVLPSITEVSRASLLSGRLTRGQQPEERQGYAEITAKVGKIAARLFHKKAVDTTAAGWSVSPDVGGAIDDRDLSLVTVVLNTIDDALERSDPAGTAWTADAVKHLEPLLARAAAAGRTVVVTSDHGHIVERRQGTQRPYPMASSARSRPATAPVGDDEVEVSGPRVLTDDHRAVLAVDETLRYGPLKSGYHGGASAAEVVVPIAVLVPDESSNPAELALLPPQEPSWWLTAAASAPPSAVPPAGPKPTTAKSRTDRQTGPTLFDLSPAVTEQPAVTVGRAVVTSPVYKAQRKITGRLIVTDDQIVGIVDALANAPANRLVPTLAAQALGVGQTRLRGALTQAQQLLNVEGYAVLSAEPATGTVILDLKLLTEQFEVHT